MRKLPQTPENWADRQTMLLFRLLDEVSETNFSALRTIIERAEQIEIDLATHLFQHLCPAVVLSWDNNFVHIQKCNPVISVQKGSVYWQTAMVCQ